MNEKKHLKSTSAKLKVETADCIVNKFARKVPYMDDPPPPPGYEDFHAIVSCMNVNIYCPTVPEMEDPPHPPAKKD